MTAPARETAGARVGRAWGATPPPWVLALARDCDAGSDGASARRLGYSQTVISQVLNNRYGAGLVRVEERVRALLMNDTCRCPVSGEIPLSTCLGNQSRPFSAANPTAARLHGACRSGCPHSKIGETRV